MADDVSVSIGGTIDGLESALGDATSAMEALVTGPVKGLGAAFGEMESIASDAFGVLKDLAEGAFDKITELGKTVVESLISAATGAGNLTGVMSKMLAIVGGGAVAAAYAAINGFLEVQGTKAKALLELSERYGVSLENIQRLNYAASQIGIGSNAFNTTVEKMVTALDEGLRKENDFTKLLDANNVKWKENGKIILDANALLGVAGTLIRNAANYSQQVKIAEWLGVSKELIPLLSKGADEIKRMGAEAAVVDEKLLKSQKEFHDNWTKNIAEWQSMFEKAINYISPLLLKLADFAGHLLAGLATGFASLGGAIKTGIEDRLAGTGDRINQVFDHVNGAIKEFTKESATAASVWSQIHNYAGDFLGAAKGPVTKLLPDKDKKSGKEGLHLAEEEARERIKLADMEFKSTEERLDAAVKVHALTEKEKTAALLAALDQRHNAELAASAKEIGLTKGNKLAYQRALDERKTLDLKYAEDKQKILDKSREAEVKSWDQTLGQLQSAFDSQLKGLLAGTTTWSQAMKSIFADLVLDIIKDLEKILIKKAALGLASTGLSAGEGGLGGLLAAALPALLAPIGLQTGAWNIPTAQLALLHPGEMVLPSGPAEQYRQGATSFSTSATNVNMSMSMFDSTGAQAMLNRIMPQLARSLQNYQALNPSRQ